MAKIALLCATALAAVSLPAAAQDADAGQAPAAGIADIVVTAERRAAAQQDVPLALTVFAAGDLEARGLTSTLELMRYVPNSFASNSIGLGSANTYFIRGIGSTNTLATSDAAVGSFIDDVHIGRQNANNFSFFDVDRIEVLRGPQSTVYGRGTTGGMVNVHMRQPEGKLGGFIEAGYGRFDQKRFRASLDIPLDPAFALKVSGYWNGDDGYVKNITTGDRLNDSDSSGIRFAGKLTASERLTWNVALAKMVQDGENLPNFTCNPADASDCKGRFATTGLSERVESGSPFAPLVISGAKAHFDLGNTTDTWLFTSNIEWAGDSFTLNAITGYVDLKQAYAIDLFDGRAAPSLAEPSPPVLGLAGGGFVQLNDGLHKQFSQEFKLTGKLGHSVRYLAGVLFHDEDNTTDMAEVADLRALRLAPTSTLALRADRVIANSTKASAAYAQVDVEPVAALTLAAGVRYTDETKTIRAHDNRAGCNDGTLEADCIDTANLRGPAKLKASYWTPRFAASYRPNDDVLLFASATRGQRSGGWSGGARSAAELLPFAPEKMWSYEGGVKSDWLDNRLRFNLTGFVIDVTDMQTPAASVSGTNPSNFITRNFVDYRNKGIELEVAALPIPGLNVYANLGWQDDTYKVDRGAPDTDAFGVRSVAAQQALCLAQLGIGAIAGGIGIDAAPSCGTGLVTADGSIATPVHTPKWSLAGGAAYDLVLPAAGIVVTPAVHVAYQSASETDAANFTLFSGSTTGGSGTVYPSNTASGDVITGSRSEAHALVSASLSLRTDDDAWLVSVECDNCLSEAFTESTFANVAYLNPPMTWTVRARRKF